MVHVARLDRQLHLLSQCISDILNVARKCYGQLEDRTDTGCNRQRVHRSSIEVVDREFCVGESASYGWSDQGRRWREYASSISIAG